MKRRPATALALVLGLAALLGTLALPGRRSGGGAEASAFAALVELGPRDPGAELGAEKRRQLLESLRSMGPAALARFLEQATVETTSDGPRLVALECLETRATRREVGTLVRLATPREGAPSAGLCDALHGALLETLRRDANAFAELVPAWRGAAAELRAELLSVVGQLGDPAGLELLAWVVTFEGQEFHRALAETCLQLAPRARGAEAKEHLETLCVLLRSTDQACVQTISNALARARVEAAVPDWIELLGSVSRGTRERARRSLEQLTGLALGATAERWRTWYESECTWFEERAGELFSELESEDDARVLAALRAISLHRLNRDELARAVEPLLGHDNPALRSCACSALEGLGSTASIPALVEALADEDEDVARSAWSALRCVTGLDLPLDEALWRAHLAGSS